MAEQRELAFKHYEAIAADLSARESHLHATICPEREKLVCNKKFVLFEQMARDAEVSDDGLLDLLVSGVPLVGPAATTGQCPEDVVPPAMGIEQAMRFSKWSSKRMIMGKKN